jgi:hypothetical protein
MISTRCTVHSTNLELWSCSAVAHLTTRMCVEGVEGVHVEHTGIDLGAVAHLTTKMCVEGEREGAHVVVCSVCYVYVIRSTHIALYWYM